MGSKDPTTGKWTARQLSNDHKPSVPSEAQRIWRCNGRVEPLKDQRGTATLKFRLPNGPFKGMAAILSNSWTSYDSKCGRSSCFADWCYLVARGHW